MPARRPPKRIPPQSPANRRLRRFLRRQDGSVAPVAAFSLTVLVGMLALSIDLGRQYNLSTELQSAVDAAALAGATQLDKEAGARDRARLAATGSLAGNTTLFADDGRGGAIAIDAADITFLVDLTTRAVAATDDEANFIQVRLAPENRRSVTFSFGAALGITQGEAGAHAVAGLGTAFCRTPPLMICNPNEPGTFDPELEIGNGIVLKDDGPGAGLAPGNFGMLALPGTNPGTNEWRDAAGRVFPLAQCYGADAQAETKTGQATAVRQGINVRFDLYEGSSRGLESNPLYAPASNTVKGLIRPAGASRCDIHNNGWRQPANRYTGDTDANGADAMGYPRDRCAYPGGPFDCSRNAGPTGRIGDGDWDIQTYMAVNFGLDWNSSGVFADLRASIAGTRPTRYETYLWEQGLLYPGQTAPALTRTNGERATPVCNTTATNSSPERRILVAAIVNCSDVAGRTSVTPQGWVRLFLTEPMGVFDSNNDLYAEIIGRGDAGGYLDNIARHTVQLYE